MTPAEFRSILEMCGYGDDTDAARALSKSRSMLQKMKSGDAPVSADVAAAVERIQDDFADARQAVLDTAPATLVVWRGGQDDNEASWAATGRPARWHRLIAAEARMEHGTRITYHGDDQDGDPGARRYAATINGRDYIGTSALDLARQAYGDDVQVIADDSPGRWRVAEATKRYDAYALIDRIHVMEVRP